MSPNIFVAHGGPTTHLMRLLMFCLIYRGWDPSVILFTITQSPSPIIFFCASANFSLEGIIGDPLITFNFSVSFFLF